MTTWSGNDCQILEYSKTELAELVAAGEPLVEEVRREAITLAGRQLAEPLADSVTTTDAVTSSDRQERADISARANPVAIPSGGASVLVNP
ncbi:MAG: hypothetical protein ACYCTE_06190 [Acidimicrobiales bacterium]